MHAALDNVNPNVVTTLLKGGADIMARDKDGWTPLTWATETNENPEVITTLLQTGANGKARSNEGKTSFNYTHENLKMQVPDAY